MSDSHGASANIGAAFEKNSDCDLIIFLGDGQRDLKVLDDFPVVPETVTVKGNCDIGSDAPDDAVKFIGGHIIYIAHGHELNVKTGRVGIVAKARSMGADIVLFGHTHMWMNETRDGVHLINPGSIGNGSYAILTLQGQQVTAEHKLIDK
jgi:putative phosphoesterase